MSRVARHARKVLAAACVWADMSPWLSDRLLSSQSDERLAALACAGSDRAFAVIVQRYARPLLAFARRLAPAGDAEDLVQQTFMSALAAMRSGAEVRHLRGWLHQILRHAATHASKRSALPAQLEHADLVTPSAQQAAELRMLTAEALAALAQLPARQHEAIVATAVQGRSRAEVAQLLGLSEGAVRQLVHRAREALRAAVTAITPYPLAQALAAGPSGGSVADLVAGAGAGSAVAVKIGALVVSGVVATGIVASGVHPHSHSSQRGHRHATARATAGLTRADHQGGGLRLAVAHTGGRFATVNHLSGAGTGQSRSGSGSNARGSDGGPGGGGDGSPGGPSLSSGSSDGGGTNSGSSPGGPSVTTATTSDGGGSGSSGSSDGGQTTTTTATTTTTSGSSDGGSSGGSGSGDTTTTTTTTSSH